MLALVLTLSVGQSCPGGVCPPRGFAQAQPVSVAYTFTSQTATYSSGPCGSASASFTARETGIARRGFRPFKAVFGRKCR